MSTGRKITVAWMTTCVLVAASSFARAVVITPVSASGTTPHYGSPTLLIDGTGLLGGGPVLSRAHESIHTKGWLINDNSPSNELIFAMPGAVNLTDIHVWQYAQAGCCTDRGVSTFDIQFSTDGGGIYSAPINLGPLNPASGTSNETAQTVSFAPQTGVTHVKINNMVPPGSTWQGLNEVRFDDGVPPVITGGMGPGGFTLLGATSDISLWLKGDAGITKDGSDVVSVWADQSGHGNDFSDADQSMPNDLPLQNTAQNGIPLVTFDGGSATEPDEMMSTSGVSAETVFLVNSTHAQESSANPVIGNSDTHRSIRRVSGVWQFKGAPGDTNDFTTPDGSEMDVNGAPGTYSTLDELQILAATRGGGAFGFTNLKLAQHLGYPERAWNGSLGEVLVFSRSLNDAEQRIVENHLSAKFDVDLDAGDVYAGDTSANGDYDLDVFGIGRVGDDQVRSAGSQGFGISSMAPEDGEWVLAGHNSPTNSWVTTDLPPGGVARWERVWYVDKTGDVDVTLAFDFSDGGLSAPDPGAQLSLLYRSTEASSFSSVAFYPTVDGDLVTFDLSGASLRDGYYTLGIVPEPGTLALLGFGAMGLLAAYPLRRRRR